MKTKMVYIVAALVLMFSMAAALMPAGPAVAATTWYVDDDTCPAAGSGTAGEPFCKIQDAINAANPAGDTIIIAAGTYNEHDITINKSLTIQGAGEGSTFVDGEDISRVFYINNSTVDMSGMTIRNGNVTGISEAGGGIWNDSGKVTITNCMVSENDADDGGGIWNDSGNMTITNCTVSGNNALNWGGGIYNTGSNVAIINCTLSGNSATHGGGIFNASGNMTITNCTVSGNKAGYYGGGIWNDSGNMTITNCTVSGNNALNWGGGIFNQGTLNMTNCTISDNDTKDDGGGIYSNKGIVTMTNCTVSDNDSGNRGGGIYNEDGDVTLTSCTVSGNMAGYNGGGIYNTIGTVTMTNCTVSGNKVKVEYRSANGGSIKDIPDGNGGGIYTVGSADTVTLNYCTITDNTAEGIGGGICNSEVTVVLKCTIVYGNTAPFFPNYGGGAYTDAGQNIVDEPPGSAPNPLLGPLQNNGGPTETHALMTGSPAIDACTDCTVETDQRGYKRPVDGDYDGIPYCDVGAYEKPPPVGGIVEPVSKLAILAPWLGIFALMVVTMSVLVITKRKRTA